MHEVHTSAGCPKQGLRVLAAMPTVGEIGSADLYGCRFVKEKSATQIVDEHGLDNGMSKPGRKTRQGHRLTRTGAVEEFGSEDIGSLHADANSTARNGLCKLLVQLGTIWNLDKGLSKACEWLNRWRSKSWQLGLLGGHAECGLVAVMDIQDHRIMRAENMGADQGLLSTH